MTQCNKCQRVTLAPVSRSWLNLGGKYYCPECESATLDRIEADVMRAGDWQCEPEEPGEGGFVEWKGRQK